MSMDFFEHQRRARKKTGWLIFLFGLAVVGITAGLYVAANLLLTYTVKDGGIVWRLDVLGYVALATLGVVGCGAAYRILQLRTGGPAVAEMLGGRVVDPGTHDPQERQLRNVVEEMSIASGVPVPEVYIMDHEDGINAFAAGYSPSDAAVAVTRGCLEQLNRQELEGVIGHEFSHVLNGDMRLNIRLMGVLFGLLCIGMAGYYLLRGSYYSGGHRSRKRDGGGIVAFAAAMWVLGFIGVFFAKLIKAAVSRQREFLADASAVQFSRHPQGIADALRKIGGIGNTKVENPHAEEASHMFFANALGSSLAGMLATHPPLEDRIAALDPVFAKLRLRGEMQAGHEHRNDSDGAAAVSGFVAGAGAKPQWHPEDAVQSAGALTPDAIEHGRQMLEQLPLGIATAIRNPFSARAAIYGLLLDRETSVRRQQLLFLQEHEDSPTMQELMQVDAALRDLPVELRLPLVDLAIPALRHMSVQQYKIFRENVRSLVDADNRVQMFEFVLDRMLLRHLDSHYFDPRPKSVRYRNVAQLQNEVSLILTVLAYAGAREEETAAAAFATGARRLGDLPVMLSREACRTDHFALALEKLERASLELQRSLLDAMAQTVAHDGVIEVAEAELLRAIADTMGCPLPPQPTATA